MRGPCRAAASAGRQDIYRAADKGCEFLLHGVEVEVVGSLLELDEEIDVRVRPVVTSGDRAEHLHPPGAAVAEHDGENVVAVTGKHVAGRRPSRLQQRFSVACVGTTLPDSIRAMWGCAIPQRSANARCVSPDALRASRTCWATSTAIPR